MCAVIWTKQTCSGRSAVHAVEMHAAVALLFYLSQSHHAHTYSHIPDVMG